MSLGADISGVADSQLPALAAYRDRPKDDMDEAAGECECCDARRAVLCNLSAERLSPEGFPEPTIFIRDIMVCRACLSRELGALRQRLHEVDFIELSSIHWRPSALVITSEAELIMVLGALRAGVSEVRYEGN